MTTISQIDKFLIFLYNCISNKGITMTSNIVELLKKEKELNKLLNSKLCPVSIGDDFKQLFGNRYYLKTRQWLDAVKKISLHDSKVKLYSERRNVHGYDISFKLDNVTVQSTTGELDTVDNNYIKISSKESLRMVNNRYILSFLIDEEKQEIAFMFEDKGLKKIVSLHYISIEFKFS